MDTSDDIAARALYDELVGNCAADLFAMAYRLSGQREVAEDLVQEAFTEAWKSLPALRDRTRARAWLMQILRFRWLHWLRARSTRPVEKAGLDLVEDRAAPRADPAAPPMSDAVQEALDSLDERFRSPFLMVFLQGMSCQEVARELDIPLGTVLSRLHRARAALRRLLPARSAEPPGTAPLRLVRRDGERP
ncbi:MAG: RNA polymerase sigma factor [Candidatus Riflebacteria bacterium]|nr:RNA polymerase sigma factor [Candidatus Riflebacteria bacterium]